MAAYRMFPSCVGPDRADELAAGDTSVDTGGEFLCGLQGGKRGAARLRPWSPRQPRPKPHQVQGRSRRQMLEMGFSEPHIARLPQATPADALCVGTLDPCLRCILPAGNSCRRLPLTGLLQHLRRLTVLGAQRMRGRSCLALVHRARCGHGVQSLRAKRTSHVIPFFG